MADNSPQLVMLERINLFVVVVVVSINRPTICSEEVRQRTRSSAVAEKRRTAVLFDSFLQLI